MLFSSVEVRILSSALISFVNSSGKMSKSKKTSTSLAVFLCILFLLFIIISFTLFKTRVLKSTNNSDRGQQPSEILMTKSGKPMFASGNCASNDDCIQAGCSQQFCANHEIVTTCEYVEIPEKETYSCGCINNSCVWFR